MGEGLLDGILERFLGLSDESTMLGRSPTARPFKRIKSSEFVPDLVTQAEVERALAIVNAKDADVKAGEQK